MNGISIVVCTYNGEQRLGNTLASIVRQITDKLLWELIVVDNASTDGTRSFCHDFLSRTSGGIQWQVVHESKPGLNHARLKGFYAAKYDIVLFCDDDNHLSSYYLQTGFELMMANPKIGALGGHGIPLFESTKPTWFDKYAHSFAVGAQAEKSGKISEKLAEVYGAGCFFRRQPLLNFFAHGFETVMSDRLGKSLASGGDVEWCYLVQLTGFEIWYDERLRFDHLMPATRMTWEYYLRLKGAIASGAARLLPYGVLLENADTDEKGFKTAYFNARFNVNRQKIRNRLASLVRSSSSPANQLASTILQCRATSFANDEAISLQHFTNLKKILLALQTNQ